MTNSKLHDHEAYAAHAWGLESCMLSVCPDADQAFLQASRVKLDERWRSTPTKTQKLCASLEAHMPASWPAEVRHSLLGRMRSVVTDLWQSIKPAKVSQPCMYEGYITKEQCSCIVTGRGQSAALWHDICLNVNSRRSCDICTSACSQCDTDAAPTAAQKKKGDEDVTISGLTDDAADSEGTE